MILARTQWTLNSNQCDQIGRVIGHLATFYWSHWFQPTIGTSFGILTFILWICRVEGANHPFVRAADEYLQSLDAVDAALIFEDQNQLDQVRN